MADLVDYLIVSAILLAVGIYGLTVKRNFIRMLFAIEIIVNAANLNLVAFSRNLPTPNVTGQTLALFSIAIAAAEVAVGLALIIVAYRLYKEIDVKKFRSMSG
ncbi:MAG: NADH-quinone oxidoreductase subunit NuoK [Nitrososphaerales archaeon]